jgi:hypothetical protein
VRAGAQAAEVEASRRRAAAEAADYARKQQQLQVRRGDLAVPQGGWPAGRRASVRGGIKQRREFCQGLKREHDARPMQGGKRRRRAPPPNLQERLDAKALEGEHLAAAKEALRARLRAMEGKLIKACDRRCRWLGWCLAIVSLNMWGEAWALGVSHAAPDPALTAPAAAAALPPPSSSSRRSPG